MLNYCSRLSMEINGLKGNSNHDGLKPEAIAGKEL